MKQVRPYRTFAEHFQVIHQFHGVNQHHIEETYTIRPVTHLGVQMLLDGVQISDQYLHLKSKIHVHTDSIRISLKVIDPGDAQEVLGQLKRTLVKQLLNFEKRFYSSPVVRYVEKFCSECVHYQSKPLNQCIACCRFQSKKAEKAKEAFTKS